MKSSFSSFSFSSWFFSSSFFFGLGFAFFAEFGVDEGFPHDFYQLVDFLDVGDAEGEVDAVVGVVVAFVVGEDLFVLFDGVELFGFAVEVQDSRELEVRLEMQGLAQFVFVEQKLDPGSEEWITGDRLSGFLILCARSFRPIGKITPFGAVARSRSEIFVRLMIVV